MSGKEPKAVAPKLRFPEFRDAGVWDVHTLNDMAKKFAQGGTPKTSVAEYWNGEISWITPAEMGNDAAHHYTKKTLRTISTEGLRNSSAELLPVNSVIISSRAPIGYVTINKVEIATNQGCKGIVPKAGVDHEFLYFSLLVANQRLNDLGAGAGFKEISTSTLKAFQIPAPEYTEQQKIANCLSSLDEVIELEARKLDALKTHKKGLMQQLFPAEGETTPRLRFPEFRDAGVWEVKLLGDIGSVSMCKRVLKSQTSESGDIPFYKIGTFGKQADAFIENEIYEEFREKYSFPNKGDILISASGTIGRTVVYDGKPAYFQDSNIVWVANNESIVLNAFLYYCYKTMQWQTDDNTISRLYNDNLRKMKIVVPSIPEQQKIANCLSSLGGLIDLQAQKVEALKQHKKGLMQQIFPQEVA